MKELILCASESQKDNYSDFVEELQMKYALKGMDELSNQSTIILLGGDGSLNYLVNHLNNKNNLNILYLPTGTANDFAKSLNRQDFVPTVKLIEEVIKNCPQIEIPLMKCNDKYFINVATGGAPALVTSDGENLLKKLTGKFEYYLKGLEQVLSPEVFEVDISHNDKNILKAQNLYGLAIAQGLYAGGGAKVTPNTTPLFKDHFSFTAVKADHMTQALSDLIEIQKNDQQDISENTLSFTTKRITLKGNKKIPFKLDGEPYSQKEFTFEKSSIKLNFYHF